MVNKEAKRLRIGVLGAGPIAQFAHLDACRRARNTELQAICDVAENLAAQVAAIHRPQAIYTNYEHMLTDSAVDAVIIATSDAFHIPLATRAVEAGKHVFIEKPLGLDIEECLRFAELCERAGVTVQVGFNRRFDPALAFARQFIHEEMGMPQILHLWYCDSVERYTMTDNLQSLPIVSGGTRKPGQNPKADKRTYFLLTHGSHLLDSARFLGGAISAVQARHKEVSGMFQWSISLEFENGCFGTATLIVPARSDFEEGFQSFGVDGSVQGRLHLPWYRKAGIVEAFSARTSTYTRPLGADADTYKLQIEAFAAGVLHQAPHQGATLRDGVSNLQALIAIARSAESGRRMETASVEGHV
jgi:predicted dehydrogenase